MGFSESIVLNDICEAIVDCLHKTAPTQDVGIPSIRTTNIRNGRLDIENAKRVSEETYKIWTQRLEPKPNDIILAREAPVGEIGIIPQNQRVCLGQRTVLLRPNINKVDPHYLLYLLMTPMMKHQMLSQSGGSVVSHLNMKMIRNLKLPQLPRITVQKETSSILRRIDNKIEINNKINKNLEEMAQAIFKRWFIDFEFPNEYGNPYKSSGGKMIESELGMIPEGWKVKSLTDIADYLNGLAMQKYRPKDNESELPVLKIRELRQGFTDDNSDKCSSKIDSKFQILDGDIIFSWSGSLLVDIWTGGKCGLNQHLFKVTSSAYDDWFIYQWTKYHLNQFIRIAENKATTMGHIKRKDLQDAKVVIPDDARYKNCDEIMSKIIVQIVNIRKESIKLKELRDTLLPKLMSGEIRIEA